METETPESDAAATVMRGAFGGIMRPYLTDTVPLKVARRIEAQRNSAFEILREVIRKDEEEIKELAGMMDNYEPEQGCLELHARIKALLGENVQGMATAACASKNDQTASSPSP